MTFPPPSPLSYNTPVMSNRMAVIFLLSPSRSDAAMGFSIRKTTAVDECRRGEYFTCVLYLENASQLEKESVAGRQRTLPSQ